MGRHGGRYAQHLLRDLPEARLVAVSRRDAAAGQAFAESHGLRFYADPFRLVADPGVEAVVVVTPPDLNPSLCQAALDAGKPVLVEKPLARTAAEAREIARRARDGFLMVAHTLRYNAVIRALRTHRGRIGPVHLISLNQRLEPSPLAWLEDPQRSGGGNVLHIGVHMFDLVRMLSGAEVVEVFCRTARQKTRQVEDLFTASFRLSSGILCTLDSSRASGGRSGRVELVGERGQLVGDHIHHTLSLIRGWEASALDPGPPVHTVQAALADFVAAVRSGAPSPIPAEDGLRAVEIAEACYRSAREGRAVDVDSSE